jgi:chitinase
MQRRPLLKLISALIIAAIALHSRAVDAEAANLPQPGLPAGPLLMGYYASWTDAPVATGSAAKLAVLPAYLDIVVIGFARPDLSYSTPGDLSGTGIGTPFNGLVLRDAIATLHARNPRMRVLLSVGGSAFANYWGGYTPDALARLVVFLGVDGVDLDYEPPAPNCGPSGGTIICASDSAWADLIQRTRAVLPRPALLSVPAWSVGAYGSGQFANDLPLSPWTGSMLWLARSPLASEIDILTILAYDAGSLFDPQRALAAYRAIWPGRLLLGVQVPPSDNSGPPYPVTRLATLSATAAQDPFGGMMLYHLEAIGGGSSDNPDAVLAAQAICTGLGRTGCAAPLP